MNTTRKTIVILALSLVFIIGCQGQYPEHEVIDNQCQQHFQTVDSAKFVIYYQPLSAGKSWGTLGDFRVDPSDFLQIDTMQIYSSVFQDGAFLKRFRNGLMKHIEKDDEYPCGYYRIALNKWVEVIRIKPSDVPGAVKERTLSYLFFTKCNPNYLGRND